jgi:hypothetical protein
VCVCTRMCAESCVRVLPLCVHVSPPGTLWTAVTRSSIRMLLFHQDLGCGPDRCLPTLGLKVVCVCCCCAQVHCGPR